MRNNFKFYGFLFFGLGLGMVRACTNHPDVHQIEENNKERFIALLDSNPIKHVQDFKFANGNDGIGGHVGPPLVNIGDIWGTVCFDGFDENAAEFFCRSIGWSGGRDVEPISHAEVEALYGAYPVLLTNVKCTENAQSVLDCTSGPMGYASCSSGNDVELGCALFAPTNPGN